MTPGDDDVPAADQGHARNAAARRAADEADRLRMLQNLAAFIFIVIFMCFGAWLIDRLAAYSRNMECIQARHRNCG